MGDNRSEFQRIHEFRRSLSAALHAKGYDTAGAVRHVFLGNLIIFAAGQSGEIHPCHALVVSQEFSYRLGVLTVTWHSEVKRFQTEIKQERILRRHHSTHVAHEMHSDLGTICGRAEVIGIDNAMICLVRLSEHGIFAVSPVEMTAIHYNAAECTGMTVHVFAGRMYHHIRAEFNRTAVDGSREGIVHHDRHAV